MSWLASNDPVLGDARRATLSNWCRCRVSATSAAFPCAARCRTARRQMVGPFIFFDQLGPAQFFAGQGIDVRPHPHIGLATVTYLFDGLIFHRDSEGNAREITPGAMNLMTAGRGIAHSERTPAAQRGAARACSASSHGSRCLSPTRRPPRASSISTRRRFPWSPTTGFRRGSSPASRSARGADRRICRLGSMPKSRSRPADRRRSTRTMRSARSMSSTAKSRSPATPSKGRGC